jgi:hypothetical protein
VKRADRPVPFPWGSKARRDEFARLRLAGKPASDARRIINQENAQARRYAFREKCGATTRRGTPCKAPAVWWRGNGRCKLHGGLSTGPRTAEGKARSLANLKNRKSLAHARASWAPFDASNR